MARYRSIRTDYFTHRKTCDLSPVARCIHLEAILAGGLLGLWEASVAKVARTVNATPGEVRDALDALSRQSLVVHFEDDEIVWAIEAADEQCRGNKKAWAAARAALSDYPEAVRDRVSRRYADQLWDRVSDRVSPTSQDKEGRGDAAVAPPDPASSPAPDPVSDPDPDPGPTAKPAGLPPPDELAALPDARTRGAVVRRGLTEVCVRGPFVSAESVAAVVDLVIERHEQDGADLHELEAVLRAAIDAGEQPSAIRKRFFGKAWRSRGGGDAWFGGEVDP